MASPSAAAAATASTAASLHRRLLPRNQIPNPDPNPNPRHLLRRRCLLLSTASPLLLLPRPAAADPVADVPTTPAPVPAPVPAPAPAPAPPAPAITDRVYLDFSLCPSYTLSDRPLGFDLAACPDSAPLGRVVFGLYGKLLPQTVANFKAMCTSSAYKGTLIHKLLPGQFFVAGRQGRRDKGEVRLPPELVRNTETVDAKAFQLKHVRPGTLSLCLAENDEDDEVRLGKDYHNVEFLVTTGPGPCPQLDDLNIVFGTVLEGLDVVTTIAAIPTYKPAERIRQFNDFAMFLGDERAGIARATWDRPLKTVYISDCGELKVAKPSLSPSLP